MKYIVAVSGGVDSVALLHMLVTQLRADAATPAAGDLKSQIIVAHVSHGIRPDSFDDLEFVWKLADAYNLPFEHVQLQLGPGASEELARNERYKWLDGIKQKHNANTVVTAHHQDDLLETIVLNLHRGTGWRGLASLTSTADRYRPLLALSKVRLVQYAIEHGLSWREDSTNDDMRYSRNYIRHGIIPKLSPETRRQLVAVAQRQQAARAQIEQAVKEASKSVITPAGLRRYQLIMLPDTVALEVLRLATKGECEPAQLRKLLHFAKVGRQGAVLQVKKGHTALLTRQFVVV